MNSVATHCAKHICPISKCLEHPGDESKKFLCEKHQELKYEKCGNCFHFAGVLHFHDTWGVICTGCIDRTEKNNNKSVCCSVFQCPNSQDQNDNLHRCKKHQKKRNKKSFQQCDECFGILGETKIRPEFGRRICGGCYNRLATLYFADVASDKMPAGMEENKNRRLEKQKRALDRCRGKELSPDLSDALSDNKYFDLGNGSSEENSTANPTKEDPEGKSPALESDFVLGEMSAHSLNPSGVNKRFLFTSLYRSKFSCRKRRDFSSLLTGESVESNRLPIKMHQASYVAREIRRAEKRIAILEKKESHRFLTLTSFRSLRA